MTDPITIAQFKALDPDKVYTSCIQVKVTSVSSSTKGKKNGKDWERRTVIVADTTGELSLGVFNERIGKLTLGKSYLICDLGVDSWKGNTTAKIVPTTSIRETTDYSTKAKETQTDSTLPKIPIELEQLSIKESTILYQIKKTVEKNITQYETLPNQGMIWQMTEAIYHQYIGEKN